MTEPRTQSFSGEGGTEIHWKHWPGPRRPAGTVVIAHGGGEHSGRYQHVADRLNEEDFAVFALDHRGHGESEGKPGLIEDLGELVSDLGTMISIAREEQPKKELFLLGHSMGGCVALDYTLDREDTLDGLVLSAPLARLGTANPIEMLAARVLSVVRPSFGVFKVDSATVSSNPEVVRAYDEDPLVLHDKMAAKTITEIAGAIKSFPKRLPDLRLPLLVMVGTADQLVPPSAARMVHDRAGSVEKQLIEYDGLFHEILNEPEQEQVMDDLVGWLKSH
ncbi:MAG: lysophospholipase [Solirubrobacteraceae bacterium]